MMRAARWENFNDFCEYLTAAVAKHIVTPECSWALVVVFRKCER